MAKKKKKKWIAEEKQKMIASGLRNETSIAKLCRQRGRWNVLVM